MLGRNSFKSFALAAVAIAATALLAQDRWELIRADYGAGNGRTDVTARIQSLIQNGMLDIRVTNDRLGGDPAPHQVKTLQIYVRDSRGRNRTLKFREGDSVRLSFTAVGPPVQGGPGMGYGALRIERAQYGVQGRSRDVTSRLRMMIDDNRLRLRVTNETMGGDPAEDRKKSLTVWYSYNRQQGQVTVPEGDTLDLPGAISQNSGLSILRAEYGVGGAVWDVTARLNSQIQNNTLNLRVTNENMGGDPAEERRKQLDVWYLYNGRPAHVVITEKDTISLPGTTDYYQGSLQITRAQYGAGYRFADVTSRLSGLVQGDSLNLRVTNDAMGGDPAPNERKVLTVNYVYGGQVGQAFANEGDTLALPASGFGGSYPGQVNQPNPNVWWPGSGNYGDLQILQASWGAGERRTDVTSRLASQVQGRKLEVRVTRDSMGGDPAPGEVKRLRVVYLWQGLRYQTNVPEGGQLSLP